MMRTIWSPPKALMFHINVVDLIRRTALEEQVRVT